MQRLTIENLGKLDHAEIRFGGLTLFAGPNDTGKSFVSKFLYSVFGAMKAKPVTERLQRLLAPVQRFARELDRHQHPLAPKMLGIFADMEKLAGVSLPGGKKAADDLLYPIPYQTVGLIKCIQKMRFAVGELQGNQAEPIPGLGASIAQNVSKSLDELENSLQDADEAWNFAASELEYRIAQSLPKNFQVPRVSQLKGCRESTLRASIGDKFDKFEVSVPGDEVELGFNRSSLKWMGSLSDVVYLESPIYWKLSNALMDIWSFPSSSSPLRDRDALTGVPGYFYELARKLRFEYTGDVAFPEIYEWLIGQEVINGRMSISKSGDMSFLQEGRSFPLQTTATGIANMGILALLIERKIIDHGTVLFMDEPEAHLHPAWQVTMAEALLRLAKAGVRVVIATHSLDILKWLEVWVKKNPDDEKTIALNQFPIRNGDDTDFDQKMARIKADLTKPFFDLYLEGV